MIQVADRCRAPLLNFVNKNVDMDSATATSHQAQTATRAKWAGRKLSLTTLPSRTLSPVVMG